AAGRGRAAQGRAHQGAAGVHLATRHPRSVMTGVQWVQRDQGVQGVQAVVLLVDDDEAKRYLMNTWLRRAGHTVIEAGTGREALEKAASAELVVLDVNLPDMLGY